MVELVVHTDRYRSYIVPEPDGGPATVTDEDRRVIQAAADLARQAAPQLDTELIDLLVAVLTGQLTGPDESQVVTRFQQLTGPVAAKGEEDTALYRWLPLPHRCEVGTDPSLPPTSAAEWHAACDVAQERWPERLTTLSTHDTKRSADARARLAALTGHPAATLDALDRWWATIARGVPREAEAVDPGSAWLVFHALVAAWPLDGARAWAAVEKSVREAGLRTSWVQPDPAFEAPLRRLVEHAVADPTARCVVDELVAQHEDAADAGALAQLLAQLLAPGVPDLYQGAERWDRSLVDPDNRRPPDPAQTAATVAAAAAIDAGAAWATNEHRRAGLPRAVVIRTALLARRRHLAAVGAGRAGAYGPLPVSGPHADRVLAFARGDDPRLAVVVARPGRPATPDATVALPPGPWTSCFTGRPFEGEVALADLHSALPVALLER